MLESSYTGRWENGMIVEEEFEANVGIYVTEK
jgi:hypothetical protein